MLRTATDEDWQLITGLDVPAHWIGLAYEEDGAVLGLGGIYEGKDGRWWASVKAHARRPVALWKAASEVLGVAGRAGVTVYALADTRIEGAETFLRRVGFEPTDEMHEGYRVYAWTL